MALSFAHFRFTNIYLNVMGVSDHRSIAYAKLTYNFNAEAILLAVGLLTGVDPGRSPCDNHFRSQVSVGRLQDRSQKTGKRP